MNEIKEEIINEQKCEEIIKILINYFKDNDSFATIEYPQSIEFKSKEYFLFMFYSCLLNHGVRSKNYHHNLIKTYETNPELFDPNFVVSIKEELLKNTIKNKIHPRYPNVAVKKWIDLSNQLEQIPNLLRVLQNIHNLEELEDFIKNMKGYGQKTGGLLIRIIYDSKVCNLTENLNNIPIDRHDIEISYLTGVIRIKNISKKEIQKLSSVYVKISKDRNINPSLIDKYLWEIGNSFCNKKACKNCPLQHCCKGKI